MKLLSAVLGRALDRRFVRSTAIALLAGVLLGSIFTAIRSESPTAEEVSAAETARYEQVEACVANLDRGGNPDSCEQSVLPSKYFLAESVETFDLDSLTAILPWAVAVLGLVGWLIGVLLTGGEWEAGTVAWEVAMVPRRGRLFTASVFVAALIAFILAILVLAVGIVGVWAAATLRGVGEVDPGFWGDVLGIAFRGVLLAPVAASVGVALGTLLRSGSAALGLGIGFVVAALIVQARLPAVGKWSPLQGAQVWILGGPGENEAAALGLGGSGLAVMAFAGALLVAAFLTLRSRDIV